MSKRKEEINSLNIGLFISKIFVDAENRNLQLKKSVTNKQWNELKKASLQNLNAGNTNLRKLQEYATKLKYSDTNTNTSKHIELMQKAFNSNELLLSNSMLYMIQSHIKLKQNELQKQEISGNSSEIVSFAKKAVAKTENLVAKYQKNIFVALIQRKTKDEIINLCFDTSIFNQKYVLELADLQVKLSYIQNKLKEAGITGNVLKIGKYLIRLSHLTRELISGFISSHVLAFSILGFNLDKDTALINKAHLMAFDKDLPDGRNTAISKITETKEGKYVEIEGFVKKIDIWKTNKDMASRILISNVSGNAETYLLVPFVNIKMHGITEGAYCNANGKVQHNSGKAYNNSVIFVEKLQLKTSLSKVWKIAFLNLSEPFYSAWPQSLNMYWTV